MTVLEATAHALAPDPNECSAQRRTVKRSFSTSSAQGSERLISIFGRDVYCLLDHALGCVSLSPNWKQISGAEAADDLGNGLQSRIAPDHQRKVLHYLTSDDSSPVRFQIKHTDGSWRWCELQLLDDAEHRGTIHCILRDVSELVAAQNRAEKARFESELALKSRSEFLANMSHELRTPLNAILGFAQMMESGMFGAVGHAKYGDYIGNIQESGGMLLSKINDLLEIASIDSGRMELRESVVHLPDLVRQVVEFHSHRAFAAQVMLRDQTRNAPIYATVDRIRMLQVITSLVSNAIKYNQAGGFVEIGMDLVGGAITLHVTDNGGGIPPSHLERIVSAFQEENSFFARSRDCVGLGLALSKEIIKLHDGRIEIVSNHGKGTRITVCLPAIRTAPAPANTAGFLTPTP